MLKIGIVGASGYSGLELVKILLKHIGVEIAFISGTNRVQGKKISELYPILRGQIDTKFILTNLEDLISSDVDCLFLATPNEVSLDLVPRLIKESNKKIIDLSGSFRLKDHTLYPIFYGFENSYKNLIDQAVYGIPELYRDAISSTRLLANPGCYPTSVILPVAPLINEGLVDLSQRIVIDAKSGVSGAGRNPSDVTHYIETNESMMAYKVHGHRHEPEILQEISAQSADKVDITFTPHLLPVNRGILSTIYLQLNDDVCCDDVHSVWNKYYANKKFVRLFEQGKLPQIKYVANTPYCDIGCSVRNNQLIIVSCIDNLLKGAASQAVQNFNIMFGFKEDIAL